MDNLISYSEKLIQEEEEQHFIEKAKNNPHYFKPIYEKYYNRLFRFLLKRHAQIDVAEEICSQTFLKALTNLNKYTYRGLSFSSWLYKIALNESNGYFRKNRQRHIVLLNEEIIEKLLPESSTEIPEILIKNLADTIQKLKKKEVQLIQLRYYEAMSFKEIGDIMEITENNAKVRCYRIIDKIRLLMPNHEI